MYNTTQPKDDRIIISGEELRKHSRGKQFRQTGTGKWMTEKDRPRRKMKPRDYDPENY